MGTGTQLKQALDALMPSSRQEEILVSFDHIELDETEIEFALSKAREDKYYRLKRESYNAELRKTWEPRKHTFDEVFDAFKKNYTVDEYNERIVKNLCYYFTEDARFEGNLQKGLLLVGGIGIGKTTLMHFFKRNQKFSYKVVSCREIESDFSSTGEKSVNNCSYNIEVATNANPYNQTYVGFCFDDLGTEANAKHFGHEKNVMAEIILNRYDNKLDYHCTHITTNLTADEIKLQYGSRVTDRMKEMFNLIVFNKEAKSRRS
jgi:DNA replication protein DnaC